LNKVKQSLKASEDNLRYKLAAKISDTFLRELNMDDYVAFAKVTESDPQEANRVKYSVYALSSLNKLLGLVSIKDLVQLEAKQIVNKIADQDLDKIHEQIFLSNSKFKTGLKRLLGLLPETEETKIALSEFDKKIKGFEEEANKKELLIFIFEKLKTIDIKGKASELVISLFDFKYLDHQADHEILKTLSIVCIRHLAIINQCFPNISANPDLKAKLEEGFLENGVLKKSGWENFEAKIKTATRSGFQLKRLDFNLLVAKIKEISQTGKYCEMAKCLSLAELSERSGIGIKKCKSENRGAKRTLDYSEDVVDNSKVGPRSIVSAPQGCANTTAKRARFSS
jgi:hypothetical protein